MSPAVVSASQNPVYVSKQDLKKSQFFGHNYQDEFPVAPSSEEGYSSGEQDERFAAPNYKLQNLYYDYARQKIPFVKYYGYRYGAPEVKNDLVFVQDYIQKLVSYRESMRASGIDFDENSKEYDVTTLI